MNEFVPTAKSLGLELNANKSQILVRDPVGLTNPPQIGGRMSIGKLDIEVVDKMKYLGVYITNNINRPAAVRERIKSAYKICYSIMPFIKMHDLPFELIRTMYHTVISPMITYGLKASAIIKRNWNSFRRAENQLINLLARVSKEKIGQKSSKSLLNGKTILKKVSWQT